MFTALRLARCIERRNAQRTTTVITHQSTPSMVGGVPGPLTQSRAISPAPVVTQPEVVMPPDTFPYKSNLVTGSLQIVLGLLAVILQVADTIVVSNLKADFISDVTSRTTTPKSSQSWDDFTYFFSYNSIHINGQRYKLTYSEKNYFDSFGVAMACIGIWTGIPFIITGIVGILLSREKQDLNHRSTLKNAYLALSLVMCCGFAPALGIGEMLVLGEWSSYDTVREICPWILLAVAFAEFTVSIIGASFGCCCSRDTTGMIISPGVTVTNFTFPQTTILTQPMSGTSYVGLPPAAGPTTYQPQTERNAPPPYETGSFNYQPLK